MTVPGSAGRRGRAARLTGIGLVAAGVAGALYVAGRLLTPDAASALFGQAGLGAVRLKSMLASIALGVAGLQVLLGAWMYRKLPLAGSPPRPVRLTHRITGFALFAFTVPIAAHCLITYGVQLTSPRVAVHSLAGCFFTAPSPPRCSWCTAGGCPAGRCQSPGAPSRSSPPCCGTPRHCGTTTATSSPPRKAPGTATAVTRRDVSAGWLQPMVFERWTGSPPTPR